MNIWNFFKKPKSEIITYEVRVSEEDECKFGQWVIISTVVVGVLIGIILLLKFVLMKNNAHLSGGWGLSLCFILVSLLGSWIQKCREYIISKSKEKQVAKKMSSIWKVKERNGKIIDCKTENLNGLTEKEEFSVLAGFSKVMFFQSQQNWKGMLAELKKIEDMGADDTDIHYLSAVAYFGLSDFKNALKYANQTLMLNAGDADINAIKGMSLYNLEEKDKALEILLSIEEEKGRNYFIHEYIAEIYFENNNYEKAIEYYDKAKEENKKDLDILVKKAKALFYINKPEKAINTCIEAEKRGLKSNFLYDVLLHIYNELRFWEKCIEYTDKAIKANKKNKDKDIVSYYYYRKGSFYYMLEDYEKSLEAVLKADALKYNELDIKMLIAELYFELKQPEKALEYINQYFFKNKGKGRGHYIKGLILCDLKKEKQALNSFYKSQELGFSCEHMTGLISQIKNKFKN